MAQSPTLLFCVGATKAGTSWLYSYFAGHPAFYLRSVKELHYFYAHETEANWPLKWLKNHIAEFQEDSPGLSAERAAYRAIRLRDCRELAKLLRNPLDEQAYVAYLTRWRTNQAVVGDFSPSYGLLSTERLRAMARILPDVRFLFVMRDPVARLWSHVRDERPWCGDAPPCAWYQFSVDRKGENPVNHLSGYTGTVHAPLGRFTS